MEVWSGYLPSSLIRCWLSSGILVRIPASRRSSVLGFLVASWCRISILPTRELHAGIQVLCGYAIGVYVPTCIPICIHIYIYMYGSASICMMYDGYLDTLG